MKTAKDIALVSIYTALLIGGQFALSGISGVEVVTVLLLAFAYYFGVVRGLFVASAFSLLRCLIFGFFPNVIILYLVYYNLFILVFGLLGIRFKKAANLKVYIMLTTTAVLMMVFFTALDDVITPVYYGFTADAAKAYAVASLAAVIPQVICTFITVPLIMPVLLRVFCTVFPSKTSAICEKNARI